MLAFVIGVPLSASITSTRLHGPSHTGSEALVLCWSTSRCLSLNLLGQSETGLSFGDTVMHMVQVKAHTQSVAVTNLPGYGQAGSGA